MAGPNAGALSLLVALLVATLAAAILVVRMLPGAGSVVGALSVVGVWWLGAIAVLVRATRGRPWARVLGVAHLSPFAWALACALVLGALLAFTYLGSVSLLPVALGALAVPAALFDVRPRWHRLAARSASLGRGDRRVDGRPLLAGRT